MDTNGEVAGTRVESEEPAALARFVPVENAVGYVPREAKLVLDHLRFCVIVAIFARVATHIKTSAGSRPHNRIGVFMSSGVTGLYGAAKFPYF
jgi:hypothetical protein